MQLLVTFIALFAMISAVFAKIDPTTYAADTYRVHTCQVKLSKVEQAGEASAAVDSWMEACSPYSFTTSGRPGNSARYWFISNPEIMVGDCTYAKLAQVVKPGFSIFSCKEQPDVIDFTKCFVENTEELVCQYGVDSSACAQCKNSAVGASIVAVLAFVVVAMFF